jgi:hypothetical protein
MMVTSMDKGTQEQISLWAQYLKIALILGDWEFVAECEREIREFLQDEVDLPVIVAPEPKQTPKRKPRPGTKEYLESRLEGW